MTPVRDAVFTIGHSTHTLDEFVALLCRHRVTMVADVRAAPYSRFNPQFKRDALAGALGALGAGSVTPRRCLPSALSFSRSRRRLSRS